MNKIKYSETLKNLKRSWKYARKNKKILIFYLIFCIFISIISAVIPIISAKVLINLTSGNFNELIKVSLIVFSIEIFRNICVYFADKTGQLFYRETMVNIQLAITEETMKLEANVIDKNSSGVFIDRLNKDSSDLADIFNFINNFLSDFISNIGVLVAVFIISKEMFLYFMVGMLILFTFQKIQMRQYFSRNKRYRELSELNTGLITELVRGIKDIKVLNANEIFAKRTFDRLRESNKERYSMTEVVRKYGFIIGSIRDLLALSFIVLGIFLVNNKMLTISSFVILYMYQSRVYGILSIASRLLEKFKDFNLASKRVFEIIDGELYTKEKFGNKKIKKVVGNFEFRNVNFSYDNKLKVLKNMSFKINANETVAFVGKSGSGKTTIFNLLTKLYDIQDGEILIDGVNINELDRDTIRGNISLLLKTHIYLTFLLEKI
jgi:ABC-type multidrug transport system fused ATPase/permease subunit